MTRRMDGRDDIYLCGECGLGYADMGTAEECEAHCRTYNACSLAITRKAVYRPQT